ncbi:MAG: response regulator [Deltaproteobacteria bacterium]|nr:response regulator [Deltaproteobacteria bacterium]
MTGRESKFNELRERAEEILMERGDGEPLKTADLDLLRLIHELEVHQVELELQNEELRRMQRDLEQSRNEYSQLFNTSPVGYVIINHKGLISLINQGAYDMIGGPRTPPVGRAFITRIIPEDQVVYHSCLKKVSEFGENASCELRLKREDNTLIYVRMEVKADRNSSDGSLFWHIAMMDITREKEAEEGLKQARDELEQRVEERTAELKQRAEQLARLSSELTLAEQRERRRLAVIIHDHLQQLLVGAKMRLEILETKSGNSHGEALEQIHDLIMESLKIARSLSTQMAPYILYERGLAPGLEWLARTIQESFQIKVETNIDPGIQVEREDLKVLLFEAARELLFNTVKHAGTSSTHIRLSTEKDENNRLRITISDRGVGFDPGKMLNAAGEENRFGLFSIRERLNLLGGSLEIDSSPGAGSKISLSVPYDITRSPEKPPENPAVPSDGPATGPIAVNHKIRVLLVDDHVTVRQGVSSFLEKVPDIEVVGEAGDGNEAVQTARMLNPHVILMDVKMPGMNGLEATRKIHSELPHIKIIGLSMYEDDEVAKAMRDAGAVAFITKSDRLEALLTAIRQNFPEKQMGVTPNPVH